VEKLHGVVRQGIQDLYYKHVAEIKRKRELKEKEEIEMKSKEAL